MYPQSFTNHTVSSRPNIISPEHLNVHLKHALHLHAAQQGLYVPVRSNAVLRGVPPALAEYRDPVLPRLREVDVDLAVF